MEINEIVSYAALGLFALAALLGFIRGIFKGTFRSLTDIAFILLNALTSALISKGIMKLIFKPSTIYSALLKVNEKIAFEPLDSFIETIEPYMEEGAFLAEAELGYILALPAVIVTPLLFMVVFFLMGFIFKIIKLIVQKLLIPKTRNAGLRFLGAILGAVRSALALAIFLVPIIGYATFGLNTLHTMEAELDNEGLTETLEEIADYEGIVTDGAFGAVSKCGGKWFFETLSTTKVHDSRISLVKETENGIEIYKSILPLMEIESGNITEKEIADINNAIDKIEGSEYLPGVLSSVMSQVSSELYENGKLFEFELPHFGKSLDPVVKKLLEVWATTDRDGVVADLRTYVNVFSSVVDHGLFEELSSEDGDLFDVLEEGEFYSDILICFYVNERTRPVVPTIANAIQSYLYEVYEEVNGFPYGDGEAVNVDEHKINEVTLTAEGQRISIAIKDIHIFVKTIEGIEYVDDIVKKGDFVALGSGLNQIRDSIFFGNSYRFLLDALLHSETCHNLGIFDSNFIESATKPNADMAELLLSRQHVAMLTMAMWDGDKAAQEDALKVLIEKVAQEDSDALKELVAAENLEKYGVKGEKGETISAVVSTLVTTLHEHEYESEEEKHIEAEKTAHILTVINSAHAKTDGATDVFDDGTGNSKSGETAEQFIAEVLDSKVATEMIEAATKEVDSTDPYNVQGHLSANDVAMLEDALSTHYNDSSSTLDDKQTIKNIADIFGIDLGSIH